MSKRDERGRDVEPAGEVREADKAARRRPLTRVFSEAVVAALSEGGAVGAAPPEKPRRPLTRVVAEAVVAAIPAGGRAQAEGCTDGESGAGA
jgi:hypothetical protein